MRLSSRTAGLHVSPIREILSVIDQPGMISFAGGLPAPESFPRFSLARVPRSSLQYGPSEGEPGLRALISRELGRSGLHCPPERILVLSGSQQGIDLVAKLFVDAGAPVALESPTYLAALQVFRFFGARFQAFEAGEAERLLRARRRPVLAYAIPTFQNPSGRCCSLEVRKGLAHTCAEGGIVLFEDDPYRDLAYDACDRTPVCSLMEGGEWVYQGSFSKTLAPGLRLGFLACSPALFPLLLRLKQAADLHSSRLGQHLVVQALSAPGRERELADLVQTYRARRDSFAALLAEHFGALADWEVPRGGLFFWLRLRQRRDTAALLARAISEGVAFMPGEPFFPKPEVGGSYLRLNFSHASAEQAARGLVVLARLLREDAGARAAGCGSRSRRREWKSAASAD